MNRIIKISLPIFLLVFSYSFVKAKVVTSSTKKNTEKRNKENSKLSKAGAGCTPATFQSTLDINNVRTTILNGGDMWWNLFSARYEIPKIIDQSYSKNALAAGAIWVGGVTNGNIRLAAQTYRQSGNDYFPGPLTISSSSINADRCRDFDKVWNIKLYDLDDFRNNPSNWANPSTDILTWPAHGNAGEATFIAPFVDLNENNKYEPLQGEYPSFDHNVTNTIPDQMLFFVYNDKGNIHSETQAVPIGLEFQAQAFAYKTNDELNNMTFYRTKIINRSAEKIDSCVFAQWAHPAIGNYSDDYVECDVNRSLGICYNGDDDDEGILGYGTNPPSVGINLLEGPKNENGDQIGLTRFVYYYDYIMSNDFGQQGRPTRSEHYYGYLRGRWKDGTPTTYGDVGKNGVDTASYMFPGITDPANRSEWTERTTSNTPGTRNFLLVSGPFSLLPGAVNNMTIAVVWARNTSGGATGSLNMLRQASDKALAFYKKKFRLNTGVEKIDEQHFNRPTAYPNPGNNQFQLQNIPSGAEQISLYDAVGRKCLAKKANSNQIIETHFLPCGTYHYQITDKKGQLIGVGKWIKQ